MANENSVPKSLRAWFVAHFVVDVLFGISLLFFPRTLLGLLGWSTYDPMTARLVGAALMGIGLESLLGRKASVETFRAMLNLKIIWSSSAIFAISAALFEGAPVMGWAFLVIFVVFWGVWVTYRLKLAAGPSSLEE